jgi:hypothetical protein
VDRLPVHELSAVNDHSLRFKYRATAERLSALRGLFPFPLVVLGDVEVSGTRLDLLLVTSSLDCRISGRSVAYYGEAQMCAAVAAQTQLPKNGFRPDYAHQLFEAIEVSTFDFYQIRFN